MNKLRSFFTTSLILAAFLLVLPVFGKNSPAYNRAFNACSQKMQDAYADCLNKPYNSVEMCQNVANGVYNRCMRGKGFYPREGEVPPIKNGNGTKPTTSTGSSSPTGTPNRGGNRGPVNGLTAVPTITPTPHKPTLFPDRTGSVAPLKAGTTSPTPTPRPKATISPVKKSNG